MPRLAAVLEAAAAVLVVSALMMVWVPLGVLATGAILYLVALALEAS